MRVVVTGATGNIGTRLVEALRGDARVRSILGIARRPPLHGLDGSDGAARLEWAAADVGRHPLARLFAGADCVVHLAWRIQPQRDPEALEETNVRGSARVLAAVAEARVPALVVASSLGAYSPGPDHERVDERWPCGGIESALYSRQKARVEALLDAFELSRPELRVVRIRPALALQGAAALEIKRLFLGPLMPRWLFDRRLLRLVPGNRRLRTQAVHTPDLADAFRRAVVRPVRGAFNVAAEPPLDAETFASALHARRVQLPVKLMRGAVDLAWRLRLSPTEPGWLDMAIQTPLMDTGRARRELGWEPRMSAIDALLELLDGMRAARGRARPPLAGGESRR